MENENEGSQGVTTGQLSHRAANVRNVKKFILHEKSEIWAAKDFAWKKLKEKRAVYILTEKSAEEAIYQFVNRFIPSRFVVTCPGPEGFKDSWCLLVYLDTDVMVRLRGYLNPDFLEIVSSGATQFPAVLQFGRVLSCRIIGCSGWNLQFGDIPGTFLVADALDQKHNSLYSSLSPGGIPMVRLILGNFYGLFDAPQRRWTKLF